MTRSLPALVLVLTLAAAACAPAPPEVPVAGADTLLATETIAPGGSIRSIPGYALTMQADGDAVLRAPAAAGETALWSTGTAGNPGARFEMRADGNAVVVGADGTVLWQNGATGTPGSYLRLGADGDLVQYQPVDGGRRAVWATGTSQVHPDRTVAGCPTGAHQALCARSVAAARSNTAARAIKFAFSQVGVPYNASDRLGPSGYDCSGLVWRAYVEAGIDIGARTSATIVAPGGPRTSIGVGAALPGDLIWYPGHIAIQLSDGQMIEAAKPGTLVRVVGSGGRGFSRAVAISAS